MIYIIHGFHISRGLIASFFTLPILAARGVNNLGWFPPGNPVIDTLMNPFVVFVAIMIAGIILTFPWLKGLWALFILLLIVAVAAFFVYAYYLV